MTPSLSIAARLRIKSTLATRVSVGNHDLAKAQQPRLESRRADLRFRPSAFRAPRATGRQPSPVAGDDSASMCWTTIAQYRSGATVSGVGADRLSQYLKPKRVAVSPRQTM